jgi:asparagine synthase (glutamine-hydrolysing)
LLGHIYPKADFAPRFLRAKSTFQSLSMDSVAAYFHSVSMLSNELRDNLFSEQFKRDLQGYEAVSVFRKYASKVPTDNPLSMVQYLDLKTYLPGDILTKVDRASMAHALEVRVPLLDHKLVEWIAGLPPEMKLKGSEGKYIFKKSLENYLPNDILYRPKMGFSIPLNSWFRNELKSKVRETLLGETMLQSGLFNQDFLLKMVNQNESGLRDYSTAIWALLMFDAFLKTN